MRRVCYIIILGLLYLGVFGLSCQAIPKRRFTEKEDKVLIQLVNSGAGWSEIARYLGNNRTIRQCRERYQNFLSPDIEKSPFTESEDELLLNIYKKTGPKWKIISKEFPGRTNMQLKNRFHTLQRRKKNLDFKHKRSTCRKTVVSRTRDQNIPGLGSVFMQPPMTRAIQPATPTIPDISMNSEASKGEKPLHLHGNSLEIYEPLNVRYLLGHERDSDDSDSLDGFDISDMLDKL